MTQPPIPPAVPGQPEQPYPPQPIVVVAQGKPVSAYAVVGLIFGVLGLVSGWCTFAIPALVAVVCGHAAWWETKDGGTHSGHGMTIGALVMGYIVVAPMAVLFLIGMIASMTS